MNTALPNIPLSFYRRRLNMLIEQEQVLRRTLNETWLHTQRIERLHAAAINAGSPAYRTQSLGRWMARRYSDVAALDERHRHLLIAQAALLSELHTDNTPKT